MVILRSQQKITDLFMILAWASPFNTSLSCYVKINSSNGLVGVWAVTAVCFWTAVSLSWNKQIFDKKSKKIVHLKSMQILLNIKILILKDLTLSR